MGEDPDRSTDDDPRDSDESTTRVSLDDRSTESGASGSNGDSVTDGGSPPPADDAADEDSGAADEDSDAEHGADEEIEGADDEPGDDADEPGADADETGKDDSAETGESKYLKHSDSEDRAGAIGPDTDQFGVSPDEIENDDKGDDEIENGNESDDETEGDGDELVDAETEGSGDEPDDERDAEAWARRDEHPLSKEEYQEQLESAKESNPPIDRDEAVHLDRDDEPTEATNGGGATEAATADGEGMFEGPESDEEMPLAVHIEEMMRRLGIVFVIGGIATLVAFPSAEILIEYFWSSHIPNPEEHRPRLYGPLEFLLTKLKVAGLAGLVVGLPVFVYQTYRFMKPGLYLRERRYYLAAVPTSLVLGLIGGLFAHFLVLPAIFSYFTAYTEGAAVIAFGLAETFNLIVMMIAMMAIVFQIPLFIQLAIMMKITSREWLEDKRLIFWGAFFGIAFIFSPDPTGMAPIIVTLTMIVLYEGTLALLRWTGN